MRALLPYFCDSRAWPRPPSPCCRLPREQTGCQTSCSLRAAHSHRRPLTSWGGTPTSGCVAPGYRAGERHLMKPNPSASESPRPLTCPISARKPACHFLSEGSISRDGVRPQGEVEVVTLASGGVSSPFVSSLLKSSFSHSFKLTSAAGVPGCRRNERFPVWKSSGK